MKNSNPNLPLVEKPMQIVSVMMPSPTMERAGRINYFHKVAEESGAISVRAAFLAGLELMRAKNEIAPGEFLAWIGSNCAFSTRTAQNYMRVAAEYLGRHFKLGKLLDTTDAERISAVESISAEVGDATVRELYVELGIVKKSKSNLGGRREGAGRPRKVAAAELAAQAEAVAAKAGAVELQKTVGELFVLAVSNDGFGAFETPLLREAVETLEQVVRRAKAILDSRKVVRKGKTLAEVLQ